MATNAGLEYSLAEKDFGNAKTIDEKIAAMEIMLRLAPSHKSAEKLQMQLKQRLAKLKAEKEKKAKKSGGKTLIIKREGAARVVIVGMTNSGKSTLLTKLTNAHPEIAEYEFTTKEPEVGIMDYKGIKIQVIEVPALTEDFSYTKHGHEFLMLIKDADLVIITARNQKEKDLVIKQLWNSNIDNPIIYYENQDIEEMKELIWKHLKLVYAYTKMPGKEPDFPPVALSKGSLVEDLAQKVHKDFLRNFSFARIWGSSSRFSKGQQVGLKHIIQNGDIVEFHIK
ncbi:MAG: 50S ribosome-binding GTPase [Candidatus Nanoarchaeia archaeon]|nr:50S ribosome-binding GTPase [Candidatus Nanoarchaeia archaeon]